MANPCGVQKQGREQIFCSMKHMKPHHIFSTACIICLALGLADVGNAMVSGLFRALGAVLFILSFITKVVHEAEATQ